MKTIVRILLVHMTAAIALACSEEPKKAAGKPHSAEADAKQASADNDDQALDSTVNDPAATTSGAEPTTGEEGDSFQDEDEDEEDEDEDSEGSGEDLIFQSIKREDNDYSLAIKVGKKSWVQKQWPDDGRQVTFPGVCSGKSVTIELKVVHEDGEEVSQGPRFSVEASGNKVKIAFEEGEVSGDDGPDDLTGELSCNKTNIKVK